MSTSEMKLCPYCSEEIKATAVKCRYCQSMLDGSGQVGGSVASGGVRDSGPGSSPGSGGGDNGNYKRLAPGVVINRYELQQLLGKGGMGEVFLAEHTYTGQKVALKAVWPNLMASEGPRKRFLQEGRVLAKLKHQNIVGLTDFFEEDGRFFLVMEYVEGETLSAYLQRASGRGEAIPFSEFARIVGGVLKGLSHAHAQTPFVVHRDIKPANVMLAKDGRVVLMDFGIARVAGGEKITSTAGVVGTYEYMSPEQVSGQAITPATDVYAVGILAYELLTGDVPFPQKSDSGYEAMEGHRYKTPPPIQERRPDCPPALVAWVEKALAKVPTERFRDAGEMLGALGQWSGSRASERPTVLHNVRNGVASEAVSKMGSELPGGALAPKRRLGRFVRWTALGLMVLGLPLGAVAFMTLGPKKDEARKDVRKVEEAKEAEEIPPAYILVSPGCFQMGSPSSEEGRYESETQHEVCITKAFSLKETEVTQEEWKAVMGNNPSWFDSCGDDCPVENVSWWDAVAYANALSKKEGLTPCYKLSGCSGLPGEGNYGCNGTPVMEPSCTGYRLPTEAEWEYAARAGAGGEGYENLDEVAWYGGNSGDKTHAVRQKKPNAWGFYDLLGNVWEWTWDWYGDYGTTRNDPLGASTGSSRVSRGGGWYGDARLVRAANRDWRDPGDRNGTLGFRLCRSQSN